MGGGVFQPPSRTCREPMLRITATWLRHGALVVYAPALATATPRFRRGLSTDPHGLVSVAISTQPWAPPSHRTATRPAPPPSRSRGQGGGGGRAPRHAFAALGVRDSPRSVHVTVHVTVHVKFLGKMQVHVKLKKGDTLRDLLFVI